MESYGVQKKLITIHTEDRDITKYASPGQFEVDLPVDHKNVVSIRLNDIELPPLYVFMDVNQNTKFRVALGDCMYYGIISEGKYTPNQLANELTGQLNACTETSGFQVLYNPVSNKLIFTNTALFGFTFLEGEEYPGCAFVFFDNYSKWGLGNYLGFDKEVYEATLGDVPLYWRNQTLKAVYSITAPHPVDVLGDGQIYLELATYNNIDELMPYTAYSSDLYYGKYGGKHNSSFAKIPVRTRSSRENYLSNIFFSVPPLERLQKLRFKFRYHDGRPVEFNNINFNFTIELTTLRNEMPKNLMVNRTNYTLS